MRYLIVVDMQKDFVSGSLGTKEAQVIVGRVREKIAGFDGEIIFTRDTHETDYLSTQEGRNLPVEHCIRGTDGWQIAEGLADLAKKIIDKPTFGSVALSELLTAANAESPVESVTLIGLCTDICVISNALLIKANLPETEIRVDASCCAGVTPESHKNALSAMKMCQIIIDNEE